MSKEIVFKGIILPAQLFSNPVQMMVGRSPAERLNPVNELANGSGWQTMTKPSTQPVPKTLVFTLNKEDLNAKIGGLALPELEMCMQFLAKLGFKLYVTSYNKVFEPIVESINQMLEHQQTKSLEGIYHIRTFDEKCDYIRLAKYLVYRDSICLITNTEFELLLDYVNKSHYHIICQRYSSKQRQVLRQQALLDEDQYELRSHLSIVSSFESLMHYLPYLHETVNRERLLLLFAEKKFKRNESPVRTRSDLRAAMAIAKMNLFDDEVIRSLDDEKKDSRNVKLISCLEVILKYSGDKVYEQLLQSPATQEQLLLRSLQEIDTISVLISYLKAVRHPQHQRQILEAHTAKAKSAADLSSCIKHIISPQYQQEFLLKNIEKISNGSELIHCLKCMDGLQQQFVGKLQYKINISDFAVFLLGDDKFSLSWLKLKKLLANMFRKDLESPYALDCLFDELLKLSFDTTSVSRIDKDKVIALLKLLDFPEWQKQFYEWNIKPIDNVIHLEACLRHIDDIGLQQHVFAQTEDLIQSPADAFRCLTVVKCPKIQRSLVEIIERSLGGCDNSDLRENRNKLFEALLFLRDSERIYLFSRLKRRIKYPEEFTLCIQAAPTAQDQYWLLKKKLSIISNSPIDIQYLYFFDIFCSLKDAGLQLLLLESSHFILSISNSSSYIAFAKSAQLKNKLLNLCIMQLFEDKKYLTRSFVRKEVETLLKHRHNFRWHRKVIQLFRRILKPYDWFDMLLWLHDRAKEYLFNEGLLPDKFPAYFNKSEIISDNLMPNNPHPNIISVEVDVDENNEDFQKLQAWIKSGLLPKLSYMEIVGGVPDAITEFLMLLQQHCSHCLRHITLLVDCEVPSSFTIQYSQSPSLDELINKPLGLLNTDNTVDAIVPSAERASKRSLKRTQNSSTSAELTYTRPQTTNIGPNIYIHQQSTYKSHNIKGSTESLKTYKMIKAGRILNNQSLGVQPVRTGRYLLNLEQPLQLQHFIPTNKQLTLISYNQLSASDIRKFEYDCSDAGYRYHEFTQTFNSGVTRIQGSIDAHEEFTGILKPVPAGVSLYHCNEDNHFYLKTDKKATLTYVVKAVIEAKQIERYQHIPEGNVIRQIIDDYRDIAQGYSAGSTCDDIIPDRRNFESDDSWLIALFDYRGGSCAQRVVAVYYRLLLEFVSPELVFIQDINNNHVILEICINNIWVPIYLGGLGGSKQIYVENQNLGIIGPTILPTEPEAVTEGQAMPTPHLSELTSAHGSSTSARLTQSSSKDENQNRGITAPTILPTEPEAVTEGQAMPTPHLSELTSAHGSSTPDRLTQSSSKTEKSNARTKNTQLSTQTQLEQCIKSLMTPVVINDITDINTIVTNFDNQHILFAHTDPVGLSSYLLKQALALDSSRLIYVIDSQAAFTVDRDSLDMAAKVENRIVNRTALMDFLSQAAAATSGTPPLLIFLWNCLTTAQRAALTTVLDDIRSLKGHKIPDNIQIISICSELLRDMSFWTRQQVVAEVKTELPLSIQEFDQDELLNQTDTYEYDMRGVSDWQSRLLGAIVLKENVPVWEKSTFIDDIEQGNITDNSQLRLINLPNSARVNCEAFLNQAVIRGYINYHRACIPMPKLADIDIDTSDFNFSEFSPITIVKNITLAQLPTDTKLVNTLLFDYLLQQKIVHEGYYRQKEGWLKAHAEKTLSLWLTSVLSDEQWYCLYAEAKSYNVNIILYIAPGIEVPTYLPLSVQAEYAAMVDVPTRRPTVHTILTNDSRHESHTISEQALIIDVEAHDYYDLIGDITYDKLPQKFANFLYTETDFIKALRTQRPIVLRGSFSEALLLALHPLLASQLLCLPDGQMLTVTAPLTFIIEIDVSSLPANGHPYLPLTFLGSKVKVDRVNTQSRKSLTLYNENCEKLVRLSVEYQLTDMQVATVLNQHRQTAIMSAFNEFNIIHIIGAIQAGKSTLIRMLTNNKKRNVFAYYGLSNFSAWAQHKDDKTRPILILDDAHQINTQLTFFIPLLQGSELEIYYQGSIHRLSPAHKVIIISNGQPFTHEQRLLQLGCIPKLYFQALPQAVVSHSLARIHEQIPHSPEINAGKGRCDGDSYLASVLMDYSVYTKKTSVCAFEYTVIEHICERSLEQQLPQQSISQQCYAEIPSNTAQRKVVANFIRIHRAQRKWQAPANQAGQHGIYIEGIPGAGKSVLIQHMLDIHGYSDKSTLSSLSEACLWFDKIDASIDSIAIIARCIEAFEAGQAVWIDEINTIKADVLQALHLMMSGFHPYSGKPAKQAGFMAFFSANSIALCGRRPLPVEFSKCCIQLGCPPLGAEDIKLIVTQQYPETVRSMNVLQFAQDCCEVMKQQPDMNTRTMLKHFAKFSGIYQQDKQAAQLTRRTESQGISGCKLPTVVNR